MTGLRGIAAIAVMEFHFAIFFLPQAKLFDILPGLDRAFVLEPLFSSEQFVRTAHEALIQKNRVLYQQRGRALMAIMVWREKIARFRKRHGPPLSRSEHVELRGSAAF